MKLVNPRLGLEVELSENQVLNITVESPVKFSEVVYHICRQAGGEEGEFILSDIEKELSMGKRTVVINNPLTVNCEEKRILSQLYKNLSEKILEDHFEEFATVNQKVIQFMDKVTSSSEYNLTYDVDFQAAGLIKYCKQYAGPQGIRLRVLLIRKDFKLIFNLYVHGVGLRVLLIRKDFKPSKRNVSRN